MTVGWLQRALPQMETDQIASCLDAGRCTPVARAGKALEATLDSCLRDQWFALFLADAVLAQALCWLHVTSLIVLGRKHADLRRAGADLRLVCHAALVTAVVVAPPSQTSAAFLPAFRKWGKKNRW